ncbi:PTS sugar transporter subunit IIB, partial [Vibrio parahaemolyticus]
AQEYGKNIDAISPQVYGMMKGDEVLEQALELIN